MFAVGLALLLSVNLGGAFGVASAEVVKITSESMNVLIRVEVKTSATSVVAHLVAPGEPDLTLPLLPGGDSRYEIETDLRPIDYTVVFEALGGVSSVSQGVSLTELGADLSLEDAPGTTSADDRQSPARRWGWLSLALAAGSLSLLAVWVLGGRDDSGETTEDGADGDSPGDGI